MIEKPCEYCWEDFKAPTKRHRFCDKCKLIRMNKAVKMSNARRNVEVIPSDEISDYHLALRDYNDAVRKEWKLA